MEKKFLALQNKNSDADFQNNEKFVQFKQQLKELKKQCKSAYALLWFGFFKLGNWLDEQSQKLIFYRVCLSAWLDLSKSLFYCCCNSVFCLTFGSNQLSISESQRFPQSAKKIPQQVEKVTLLLSHCWERNWENKTKSCFIKIAKVVFKF